MGNTLRRARPPLIVPDDWLSFCPCRACESTPCDCGRGFAYPGAHADTCVMRVAHDARQPVEMAIGRARRDPDYQRSVLTRRAGERGNAMRWA